MANNFKEGIDEILIKKDFDFYGSSRSVEKVMEVLDKYNVDQEVLLENLKKVENIRYGKMDEVNRERGEFAHFVDKKFLGLDLPDTSEVIITHQGGHDFRLDTNMESVQLSRGLVDALSARQENNENVMGMSGSLDSLSWCVRDQIIKDVYPEMSDKFVFEGTKYRLMNEYFDVLMKIDGQNLVNNYFDTKDEFKYDSGVKELNDAIKNISLNFDKENIPEESQIHYEGRDSFFLKEDIDKLNNVYCQYAGTKLKELPADEVDFYKGQIMSLPGITDEHLKILENPKEVQIDNRQILEDKLYRVLDENSISAEKEREALTQTLLKFKEYGFTDDELVGRLSNIKGINYVDEVQEHKNVQFENDKGIFHNIIFGRPDTQNDNVIINVSGQENLMENKYFVNGVVDALSVKPEIEYPLNQSPEIRYHFGIDREYSQVGEYIKSYIVNDISSVELPNKDAGELNKHFDILLDVDKSLIKKYISNEGLSPKGVEFLETACDRLNRVEDISERVFNKVYCEYLGECTKDLSNDEYEFMKNRVEALSGMTKEHLEIMDNVRENTKENVKDIIDEKEKAVNNEIVFE